MDKFMLKLKYNVSTPFEAYRYARNIIREPFPDGEELILTSAQSSFYYASYVLEERWTRGERVINSDTHYRRLYNTRFGVRLELEI